MQDVYADLSGNVLLHAAVPALGLRAVQWAIISWGHTHAQLPEFADSRFTYRWVLLPVVSTLIEVQDVKFLLCRWVCHLPNLSTCLP